MDPFALLRHLEDRHDFDWCDDLDADAANRLHHHAHKETPTDHAHEWAGTVADPQPPMKGPSDQ